MTGTPHALSACGKMHAGKARQHEAAAESAENRLIRSVRSYCRKRLPRVLPGRTKMALRCMRSDFATYLPAGGWKARPR